MQIDRYWVSFVYRKRTRVVNILTIYSHYVIIVSGKVHTHSTPSPRSLPKFLRNGTNVDVVEDIRFP